MNKLTVQHKNIINTIYKTSKLSSEQFVEFIKALDFEDCGTQVRHLHEIEIMKQISIWGFNNKKSSYNNLIILPERQYKQLMKQYDDEQAEEAEGVGKTRTQKVDSYFNYAGQVDIAYTEEELAEIKEQEEQKKKKRLEKQREREKVYREKRQAKKIAENGGEIVKKKTGFVK